MTAPPDDETSDRVVVAARDLIVSRGYHGVGLEQVAAAAGITRVTVYRRFGSKRGVLDAVAGRVAIASDVVARADAARDRADPVEAFTGLIAALCRLWAADPDLMRRLVGLAAVDPDVADVIAAREAWRHERLVAAVRRLSRSGHVRAPFTTNTASGVVVAMTAFGSWETMTTRVRSRRACDLIVASLGAVLDLERGSS